MCAKYHKKNSPQKNIHFCQGGQNISKLDIQMLKCLKDITKRACCEKVTMSISNTASLYLRNYDPHKCGMYCQHIESIVKKHLIYQVAPSLGLI